MKRFSVILATACAGLLLTLAVATPASAHTSLIDVTPEEGSTVAAGDAVTLTFSEDLLTIGAEATVTDSAGTVSGLDVSFPTGASVQVVLPDLAGGAVLVAWRVVANDGHPIEGALTFDALVPATPSAMAPTAASSSTPSVTPVATASETPSPADNTPPTSDGGTGGEGFPVALWIAVAAAFLAFGAVMLARKKRP